MNYCSRCLYPSNHPLGIIFDSKGVCSGCRIHEEKDILNWDSRFEKLRGILKNYKSASRGQYDCVIPVSGARDSYFIVHVIKNVFGLRPLLVTYNKQYNTEKGIRNLSYLRTVFDCDLLTLTVNPETVKKITKVSLQKMGSMYWHCLAGQSVFPVQIAVRFKIPLIVWGAHQGIDQVGMFSHTDQVEMTRKYRKEHDLMGFEAEDMGSSMMHLSSSDLAQFAYPHDKEIEKVGVRGIYLNNFIRWDSKAQHEKMIELYDYESGEQSRTFDTYNDVDCFHYSDVHDYIKFLKYGYGKAMDHACREIRLSRMSRSEGIAHVMKYASLEPKSLQLFLDWIGISKKGFYFFINQFRDPLVWTRDSNGEWILRKCIFDFEGDSSSLVEDARLPLVEDKCEFKLTGSRTVISDKPKYTVLGRGFVNPEDRTK
ncbi:N-acetyl sugar amidotransferase [archaeon]|nr:N-acetyl sugar amidotransferase [archaeon]MBT6697585.1 N-acetyl sugar amidotransferase [archaeon]